MEIIRQLGAGSYGNVYLAKLKSGDLMFALKTMNHERRKEFYKESKILHQLKNSPYVVTLYDYREFTCLNEPNRWGLSLEYAQGGDLFDFIESKGGKLEESDVKIYTRMIIQGLYDIHSKGYVHCDLKPENILIFPSTCSGKPILKITDFGLAKEPEESQCSSEWIGKFRGTPLYMSPESVSCGYISSGLDIWSLGCIVIQMMTGYPPWPHREREDMLKQLTCSDESPKLPENMSDLGLNFLGACFYRELYLRFSAEELLDHPFVKVNQSDDDFLSFLRSKLHNVSMPLKHFE